MKTEGYFWVGILGKTFAWIMRRHRRSVDQNPGDDCIARGRKSLARSQSFSSRGAR